MQINAQNYELSGKHYPFYEKKQSNVSFKGVPDKITWLMSKAEQDFYRLTAVNLLAMFIPRTLVDYHRNKYAGDETLFFESLSLLTNYIMPGALALGTSHLFGLFGNKERVNTKMFVTDKTIDTLHEFWKKAPVGEGKLEKFITSVLTETKGLNGKEWKSIDKELISKQAKELVSLIMHEKSSKKIDKALAPIISELASSMGSRSAITVQAGAHHLETTLDRLVKNIYGLGANIFKRENEIDVGKALNKLKKVNCAKTVIPLVIVAALAFSNQFINRMITKWRTGKDEFVGYKDFTPAKDNKQDIKNSKTQKNINFAGNLSGKANNSRNISFGGGLSNLIGKYEFNNFFTKETHFRDIIWPAVLAGKISASRDKNERRENYVKYAFSYLNFLFLPGLAGKIAALLHKDPKEINRDLIKNEYPSNFKNVLLNYDLKSVNKNSGWFGKLVQKIPFPDSARKFFGLKIKTYKEIEDFAAWYAKKDPEVDVHKLIKSLQKIKNRSMISGILYACLTLGIGIPILNMLMTDRQREEDRKIASQKLSA